MGLHPYQNEAQFLILWWSPLLCMRTPISSGFGYSKCCLFNNWMKFFKICHFCSSEETKNCFLHSFRQDYLLASGLEKWLRRDHPAELLQALALGGDDQGEMDGRRSSAVVSSMMRCPWCTDYCAGSAVDLNYLLYRGVHLSNMLLLCAF